MARQTIGGSFTAVGVDTRPGTRFADTASTAANLVLTDILLTRSFIGAIVTAETIRITLAVVCINTPLLFRTTDAALAVNFRAELVRSQAIPVIANLAFDAVLIGRFSGADFFTDTLAGRPIAGASGALLVKARVAYTLAVVRTVIVGGTVDILLTAIRAFAYPVAAIAALTLTATAGDQRLALTAIGTLIAIDAVGVVITLAEINTFTGCR
jgi:hypothetical protein